MAEDDAEEAYDQYLPLKTHPSLLISAEEYERRSTEITEREVQRLLCSEEFQRFVSDPSPKIPNFVDVEIEEGKNFSKGESRCGLLSWGCCGLCPILLFFLIRQKGDTTCPS